MRLVLFDIDGTLLWTDGAGRRAIHRAMLDEMGTAGPIDRYRFDGKTDPQIVRELLRLAAHPEAESDARVQAVCERYVPLLQAELARATQPPVVFPGVRALLASLADARSAGRVVVGLLTGNLERGAALKLDAAGIDRAQFSVGAYGSDSAHRGDLPAIAAQRAHARTGRAFAGPDVVILGDTPDDIACGRPLGARVLAVATGSYGVDALRAAGAHAALADLSDTAAVLETILG